MIDSFLVLLLFSLYVGVMFFIALRVERTAASGPSLADNPFVYSLSLAVYCTTWTYYGAVGSAASSGPLFLTIYLGPTIGLFFFWIVVRKMVRIKREHHITSIADFLSARYSKSHSIAALASIGALIGLIPYIALQLKSVITTFYMITVPKTSLSLVMQDYVGLILVVMIIVFTIMFGVRRVDPTERHQGMITVVAVESVIKLVALVCVGAFVTWFMFDGFGDLLGRAQARELFVSVGGEEGASYVQWTSYLVLAMFAIIFLPRQFHVTVVENSDERHLRTAMWFLPLYLFIINIFVLPIAIGGRLSGLPLVSADFYVLKLPLLADEPMLALLAFIGGFSAATSMIMITSMTMAVMASNHLIIPLVGGSPRFGFLKRHLLLVRWAVVAAFILTSYGFYKLVGESYMLLNMGLVSFAAVLQFAPAALGGLFWEEANKRGALWGMGAGFAVWAYTLLLPSLALGDWVDTAFLENGPFGIWWLRPESLFGVTGLDPVSHCVFWSMMVNVGLFILVSSLYRGVPDEDDEGVEHFGEAPGILRRPTSCSIVRLEKKLNIFKKMLTQYFHEDIADSMIRSGLAEAGLNEYGNISIIKLAEFHAVMERNLAGAIGSASAHKALNRSGIFTSAEIAELSDAYGEMLAEMRLSPEELVERIDFYKERESLLTSHARELEDRIEERDKEIRKRKRIESALRQARKKYRDIFENSIEGIFQCTPDGGIIDCNPAFLHVLGYRFLNELKGEVETIPGQVLENPDDWFRFIFLIRREGSLSNFETRIRKRGGGAIWVRFSARGISGESGDLEYIEGALEDVTERKKAREEVVKLNLELEQRVVERTAELEALNKELEAFSYSVSHDLRAPLRSIDGFSQVLVEDYSDRLDDEGRGYLDRVRRATQRMGELIDDILHLGSVTRSELKREKVDLSAMAGEILDDLARRDPDRTVSVQLKEGMAVVADPRLVRVLLENLLGNAWKFTSKSESPSIEFGADDSEGHTVFFVRDNGAGFDMEYVDKIFGAFNRLHTPDEFEGTGIGLAIVQRVTQRHGGIVWARGEVDKGAEFRFTLEP